MSSFDRQLSPAPAIRLLSSPDWEDYELLDSGAGTKLEHYGPYTFVRPEVQAIWSRALPTDKWEAAHAVFLPSGEESGGHWQVKKTIKRSWSFDYKSPQIQAQGSGSRHMGVFS